MGRPKIFFRFLYFWASRYTKSRIDFHLTNFRLSLPWHSGTVGVVMASEIPQVVIAVIGTFLSKFLAHPDLGNYIRASPKVQHALVKNSGMFRVGMIFEVAGAPDPRFNGIFECWNAEASPNSSREVQYFRDNDWVSLIPSGYPANSWSLTLAINAKGAHESPLDMVAHSRWTGFDRLENGRWSDFPVSMSSVPSLYKQVVRVRRSWLEVE